MQTSYSLLSRLRRPHKHYPSLLFSSSSSSVFRFQPAFTCRDSVLQPPASCHRREPCSDERDFARPKPIVYFLPSSCNQSRGFHSSGFSRVPVSFPGLVSSNGVHKHRTFLLAVHCRGFFTRAKQVKQIEISDQHSQRAVTTALWCNFLVFSLKFGVWFTTSSHVMLAEVVHSIADFANQALLAYGLRSSRRAPDALHP
ncbi:Metal tolerance protein C4 [Linum perenne]